MSGYFIARNGKPTGPYLVSEIQHRIQSGDLAITDLCWKEGMTEWQPISAIQELGLALAEKAPPPIPTAPLSLPILQVQVPSVTAPMAAPILSRSPPDAVLTYVSIQRFVLLSVLSFGTYEAWWSYKNWQYLKKRDGLDISPFWRGWFMIFYIHKLLATIHDDKEANSVEQATFNASRLATTFIIIFIVVIGVSKIPGESLLPLLICGLIPTWAPIIPVQSYLNRVNQKRHPQIHPHKWSIGQVVCLLWGLLWWFIALVTVGNEVLA